MSALLLGISFASTKLLGPEKTARWMEHVGLWRRRAPRWRKSRAPHAIACRVERALRFVPLPIECLDQAMVVWYLLNREGHAATLKIGMKLAPLTGHAWVTAGDESFVVIPDIEDFTVVAEFAPW